jgi:hypothetical protein
MTAGTQKVKRPYRQGGPYPRLRVPAPTKWIQGAAVADLVAVKGLSFRQAAAELDMSATTAWRRYWWVLDSTLPAYYGRPHGPIPPQRGTAACPRGRPYLPTLDDPPKRRRRR